MPFRILLAGFALALCIATAQPHDPSEIRRAAGDVTKDLGVQSRLPNSSGTEEPEKRPPDRSERGDGGVSIPAPAAVFTLLQWVLIAVAVVAIFALLAIVLREKFEPGIAKGVSGARMEPEVSIPPSDPRALLACADELAAAGRFAEAMHCVLLAAMTLIGGGQAKKAADSLTSWELLRAASLPPPQLQALRELVVRVERAWFGKRPAEMDDYRYVRGRFEAFAAATLETA